MGRKTVISKPVKWGIRVDALVDQETKYLWRFRLYTGRVTVPPECKALGVMGYIVKQLLSELDGKGHKLTVDRGYTSPILFHHLALMGVGANGTCQTNRKGFPANLIKKKSEQGHWTWLRAASLLAVRWFDSNQNYFLSNFHYSDREVVQRCGENGARVDVRATTMVRDYNLFMNGVDVLDQMTRVDKDRKQKKWTIRALVKALEWVYHNTFILEQAAAGPPHPGVRKRDLLSFRMDVVHVLVGETRVPLKRHHVGPDGDGPVDRLNSSLSHYPEIGDSTDSTCVVCRFRYSEVCRPIPGCAICELSRRLQASEVSDTMLHVPDITLCETIQAC